MISFWSKIFKSDPTSLKNLERTNREKLASLKTEDLENLVFRYDEDYFKYLGEHHKEIQAFKKAVESRKLDELKEALKIFYNNLNRIEREAGHQGRPLIMDYYFWYEHEIEELEKR